MLSDILQNPAVMISRTVKLRATMRSENGSHLAEIEPGRRVARQPWPTSSDISFPRSIMHPCRCGPHINPASPANQAWEWILRAVRTLRGVDQGTKEPCNQSAGAKMKTVLCIRPNRTTVPYLVLLVWTRTGRCHCYRPDPRICLAHL